MSCHSEIHCVTLLILLKSWISIPHYSQVASPFSHSRVHGENETRTETAENGLTTRYKYHMLGTTCSTLLASTFCCMRVWSAVSGASHSGVRSRKASSSSSSFTKVNDLFNRSVFFAAVCFVFCLLLSCYQWIVIQTSTETRTHVCTHACTHTCTHAHTYTEAELHAIFLTI